jgi:hypothetical protein
VLPAVSKLMPVTSSGGDYFGCTEFEIAEPEGPTNYAMELATIGLGPDKTASFKPLREKPDSVLRCPKNLHQLAATAPEDVDVATQRILVYHRSTDPDLDRAAR